MTLGVLMLDTRFTRFVGDIGNPQSYVEPVLFAAVLDKYMDKSSGLKLADKICLPAKVATAGAKERAE